MLPQRPTGSQAHRTPHPRAAEPAVPAWVLVEVLLVVSLGVEERPDLVRLGGLMMVVLAEVAEWQTRRSQTPLG